MEDSELWKRKNTTSLLTFMTFSITEEKIIKGEKSEDCSQMMKTTYQQLEIITFYPGVWLQERRFLTALLCRSSVVAEF